MNETDGDYRRISRHKVVFYPQLFLTYTPMISQSMLEQGASNTQTTCASNPITISSQKYSTLLTRQWVSARETTVCVKKCYKGFTVNFI